MDAAESVLRDAVDGIPPAHLFACAEVYHVDHTAPVPAVVRCTCTFR